VNQKINCFFLSPAGHTGEASYRIGLQVAMQLDRFVFEGCTQGSVNFPVIETRPVGPNKMRILNVHKNVRGVVRVSF
jgi:D-3-phosphoglycerate dehydrogenase